MGETIENNDELAMEDDAVAGFLRGEEPVEASKQEEPEEPEEKVEESENDDEPEEPKKDEEEPKEESKEESNDESDGEKPKVSKSVKKLLAKKNEWKQRAKEAEERLAKLESGELDEEYGDDDRKKDLDVIGAMQDKKLADIEAEKAELHERQSFFESNPEALSYKDDLDSLGKEHPTMSLDGLNTLYKATHDPVSLLDEQTKNKLKGGNSIIGSDAVPSKKGLGDMSVEELENELEDNFSWDEL